MHETPKRVFEQIEQERPPCERNALLHDHVCSGPPDGLLKNIYQMEHAWIYAGKQIIKKWAIIRTCWWAHQGPGLDKKINHWISLGHATDEDLKEFPRRDWEQERRYLNALYGKPVIKNNQMHVMQTG